MPIETPKGTFYHLPKAGGTWLAQVLIEQFQGKYVGPAGGHIPVWAFPPQVAPAFGVGREPYSWYQSYYRYALRAKRQGGLAYWGRAYAQDYLPSITFRAVLYGMTHPHAVPAFEQGVLGIVYQPVQAERAAVELHSGNFGGFASWVYYDMFLRDPNIKVVVLNQANLNEQLGQFMGEPIRPTRKPAENSTKNITADTTYDDEMREWVDRADGRLIKWLNAG